ncbi:hypothetical protein MFLAVUS_001090 [Mucor flavus]|uniref:Uncharacterized protein n=1 Tax=Mucor flavus TaxID=439312 RepID=A0ABP9YLH4_9FUNG
MTGGEVFLQLKAFDPTKDTTLNSSMRLYRLFLGRDFKIMVQVMPSVLSMALDSPAFTTFRNDHHLAFQLGELSSMVYMENISSNFPAYLTALNTIIEELAKMSDLENTSLRVEKYKSQNKNKEYNIETSAFLLYQYYYRFNQIRMPSYRQRLLNLAYIVEKKCQKLNRNVPDTTVSETQEREEAEDRKRKREDDFTTAGRSTKRNTADSVGEGSTASAVESASISADIRSTTVTIRSNIAGQGLMAARFLIFLYLSCFPAARALLLANCFACVNVGRGYRRFVRKTGLESCIILAQQEKDTFLRIIRETVEDYGEIAIKSQLFASFYIRHCLSNNLEIPPIVFNQAFFYVCIQKILGRNITKTNVNLPREHINTVFQEYNRIFFICHFVLRPNRNVPANALASLATSSAVNLDVTAAQRRNLQVFIFNHSVNSTTRTNWPEIYLEEYNNGQITAFNEVQTEATYAWLKQTENTDTRIEDYFRPETATPIKQYKMFSLTSLYSFTLKYVEIDIVHLKSLLLKARR